MSRILFMLLCLCLGLIGGFSLRRSQPPVPATPPSIQQIQQIGLLSTLRLEVAEVREVKIDGFTGGATLILILRGDVLLGVDLLQAKLLSSDPALRQMVIELPAPAVTQARVDTQRSRVYRLDHSGLWAMRPQDEVTVKLINSALADAQQRVNQAVDREDLLELSRRQAQELITHAFDLAGWKVEIRWRT